MEDRKPLEKKHFEALVNDTVEDFEMEWVNSVWMYYSGMFESENDMVLFYHTFGKDGMLRMHCERAGLERVVEILREEVRKEHDRYIDVSVRLEMLKDSLRESEEI